MARNLHLPHLLWAMNANAEVQNEVQMLKSKSLPVFAGAGTLALSGVTALGLLISPAPAATIVDQTLHGFCGTAAASSTCSDNGVITPTSQNPLSPFGFTRSPDSN